MDIEKLKTIKELNASNNLIQTMDFLNGLNNLEKVHLENNNISKIPLLYGLISLKFLSLKYILLKLNSNNKLTTLENMICLPNLEYLEILGNDLKDYNLIQSQTKLCKKLKNVSNDFDKYEEKNNKLDLQDVTLNLSSDMVSAIDRR